MTDLTVQRDQGDKPGDNIIDPLLTTTEAALARGRAELDESSRRKTRVKLTTMYRPGVALGQIINYFDSLLGGNWAGKIIGISHKAGQGRLITELDVIRHEPNP